MSPLFLLRRQKYAAGFRQRLGNYPEFKHDGRNVIWLHCVSVGETNAARPLVDGLKTNFLDHRLIISTTTLTGQTLAQDIFKDKADAVFYFPFDWKFSVRKALAIYKPSIVLLMETEIWPRFVREAKKSGAKIAIVNGRLSERSFRRYSKIRPFISRVLADVDLAAMQAEPDAKRIRGLGIDAAKIVVTSNLKFDDTNAAIEDTLTEQFRERFGITPAKPLIVAASTHEPEERWVIESLDGELGSSCRLLIAPRHPERFDDVAKLLGKFNYSFARRTEAEHSNDRHADVILLDSIGELRAAYSLAEIVFVGGSLIPHGGQSVIEPAIHGKAIVTGPYTMNFEAAVKEFLENDAILQTPVQRHDYEITERLYEALVNYLLEDEERRQTLGRNAAAVVGRSNRDATESTISSLRLLMNPSE
jgi:3-deoxy-D-manno-octulosonic-acid transferase